MLINTLLTTHVLKLGHTSIKTNATNGFRLVFVKKTEKQDFSTA